MKCFDDIRALKVKEVLIPEKPMVIIKPKKPFITTSKNKEGILRRLDFDKNDAFLLKRIVVGKYDIQFEATCGNESVVLEEVVLTIYFSNDVIEKVCAYVIEKCLARSAKGNIKTKSKKVGMWA